MREPPQFLIYFERAFVTVVQMYYNEEGSILTVVTAAACTFTNTTFSKPSTMSPIDLNAITIVTKNIHSWAYLSCSQLVYYGNHEELCHKGR